MNLWINTVTFCLLHFACKNVLEMKLQVYCWHVKEMHDVKSAAGLHRDDLKWFSESSYFRISWCIRIVFWLAVWNNVFFIKNKKNFELLGGFQKFSYSLLMRKIENWQHSASSTIINVLLQKSSSSTYSCQNYVKKL